jgi:hypothetical protein
MNVLVEVLKWAGLSLGFVGLVAFGYWANDGTPHLTWLQGPRRRP